MFVVGLVEEDIFTIVEEGGGRGTQETVGLDAVFEAELFPEFTADLVAALAYLEGYYFAGHVFFILLLRIVRMAMDG